jgi:hypothetical protein
LGQYDRVRYEGKQVTRRQRQAIKHCDGITLHRFGLGIHIYQGSWRPKTDYSGTTHTNAGVCDLYVYGMSTMGSSRLNEITRILRGDGRQAAQLRGPFVDMPWHWHVCDLDTNRMDPNAVWQVGQYRAPSGPYDGLVAGRRSHNPWTPDPIRRWDYRA